VHVARQSSCASCEAYGNSDPARSAILSRYCSRFCTTVPAPTTQNGPTSENVAQQPGPTRPSVCSKTLAQACLPNPFSCKALMDSTGTKFSPIPQTKIRPTTILVSQVEIGEIATECPENLQCVRSMRGIISVDVPGRHSRPLLGQRKELHTIGCHVARSHGCRSLICRRRDQPAAWTGGRRRTRP
jgi:hypothetical protein